MRQVSNFTFWSCYIKSLPPRNSKVSQGEGWRNIRYSILCQGELLLRWGNYENATILSSSVWFCKDAQNRCSPHIFEELVILQFDLIQFLKQDGKGFSSEWHIFLQSALRFIVQKFFPVEKLYLFISISYFEYLVVFLLLSRWRHGWNVLSTLMSNY